MSEKLKNESPFWKFHAGDWYTIPENQTEYDTCPVCKEKPRTWIFDNGSYAKCLCFDLYQPGISSPSINAIFKKDGNTINYSRDNLKNNWNTHIKLLGEQ